MQYRAEVDGLRAVAVIAVIIFHAGFSFFPGGYAGVDVFFVISGYLITSILLAELHSGRFSLASFYERRVRRILPALFFVCAVTLPFSWFLLVPDELKTYMGSMAATALFSSNVFFWRVSGYFGPDAEVQPLLHTWSLGVEEQYYLIFPVALIVFWRLGVRALAALLFLVVLLSLAIAIWAVEDHASAAFFLLPSRAWELLAGALVAFYHFQYPNRTVNRGACNIFSLIGFAMVLASFVVLDEHSGFPGLPAMLPVTGAMLLVLFAWPGTLIGALLASRPFVLVGLMSYSAYLWHQPLLAFSYHAMGGHPPAHIAGLMVFLTLPLAWLSWKYVETPFRNRARFSSRNVFSLALVSSLLAVVVGVAGYQTNGFRSLWLATLDEDGRHDYALLERATEEKIKLDDGACRFKVTDIDDEFLDRLDSCSQEHGSAVLVIGDSHANDLFGALLSANPNTPFLISVSRGGCRPHVASTGCPFRDIATLVERRPEVFSAVIYHQAGFYLMETDQHSASRDIVAKVPFEGDVAEIRVVESSVDKVREYLETLHQSVPVTWFGPRIEPHIPLKNVMIRGCDDLPGLRSGTEKAYKDLDQGLMRSLIGSPVKYISAVSALGMRFPRDFGSCDGLLWSDGDHFSAHGERVFGERYDLMGAVQ